MNQTNDISPSPRQKIAYVSLWGTTQLHQRNPYIIAWWSMAFPGSGHMLLSKYLRGFLLFIWEVIVNLNSNLNLALFYSFTGQISLAKEILNTDWLLLYIPTYIFAIWDSYRTAVDLNGIYLLAAREDAKIIPFRMGALEINYLDKRKPWIATAWSALMPGSGQLYIHRIITAGFILSWWIVLIYFSKLLPAIHFSLIGSFHHAKEIVNIHWLLNIPSVYMFAVYDAYVNTVENNKLFDWEQSKFLKQKYQSPNFKLPSKKTQKDGFMHIISTFEHSKYLELAITAIQMKGIPKEDILAVPLDKRGEHAKLFDTLHSSDGVSLMDLSTLFGAIFLLFGTIYGFLLKWGPILWGLIGLLIGFSLGFFIKFLFIKKYTVNRQNKTLSEVVLIISCSAQQVDLIHDILWSNHALGVRKLELDRK